MKEENIDFGNRLRLKLDSLGWNAARLCRAMGRTDGWLSKILKGERGMTKLDVFKVAHILNISADELSPYPRGETPKISESEDDVARQLLEVIPAKVLDRLLELKREKGG